MRPLFVWLAIAVLALGACSGPPGPSPEILITELAAWPPGTIALEHLHLAMTVTNQSGGIIDDLSFDVHGYDALGERVYDSLSGTYEPLSTGIIGSGERLAMAWDLGFDHPTVDCFVLTRVTVRRRGGTVQHYATPEALAAIMTVPNVCPRPPVGGCVTPLVTGTL